jgi:hypothetical protein
MSLSELKLNKFIRVSSPSFPNLKSERGERGKKLKSENGMEWSPPHATENNFPNIQFQSSPVQGLMRQKYIAFSLISQKWALVWFWFSWLQQKYKYNILPLEFIPGLDRCKYFIQ